MNEKPCSFNDEEKNVLQNLPQKIKLNQYLNSLRKLLQWFFYSDNKYFGENKLVRLADLFTLVYIKSFFVRIPIANPVRRHWNIFSHSCLS